MFKLIIKPILIAVCTQNSNTDQTLSGNEALENYYNVLIYVYSSICKFSKKH